MRENEELCVWLDQHKISYDMRHDVVYIHGFGKAYIMKDYDHIFKKVKGVGVRFNCNEDLEFLKNDGIFYVVFQFGTRWFYVDIRDDEETIQFKILRYVGSQPKQEVEEDYYPLGIHTGYELLNGSGSLKDWCSKAKFYGYKGIGICDENTMAATLDLQNTASGNDLKYVFGYSVTVVMGDDKVNVKIYCLNDDGLKNMLRIQKAIGVDNIEAKTIDMIELMKRAKGNVIVIGKMMGKWMAENEAIMSDIIKAFNGRVYFQCDFSEYRADRIDSQLLESQKAYFDNYYLPNGKYLNNVRPILLQDVYYLDDDEWKSKIILNKVDIGAAHEQSRRQFMKTIDELYDEFDELFSDKYGDNVFHDMCQSTVEIMDGASACYDLTDNYMPQYIMTAAESRKYKSNRDMFNRLLEEGFKKYVPEGKEKIYRERLEYEKRILEETDSIDYLLVQYDTVNWARKKGILVGIGRGSAGGSLCLYLLGITQIDPIRYDLIFERFLIPERAGLEQGDVTVICDNKIDSDDYFNITLEDGKTYQFDKDAMFKVKRGDETLTVYADELEEGDDIVFDNRDLLFTLKEY